jgi:hypothetical protein
VKIIAQGNNSVIIDATPQEVNMLAGKNLYVWNGYYERWDTVPKPGTTFNVVAGITQLHRNAERSMEVYRIKKQLESLILQLELVEPFMKEPDPAPHQEEMTEIP